jgi:hypothetical protein
MIAMVAVSTPAGTRSVMNSPPSGDSMTAARFPNGNLGRVPFQWAASDPGCVAGVFLQRGVINRASLIDSEQPV